MEPYLIILICIAFSAFFSGIEIAFVTANRLKIEVDKTNGVFSARILSYFSQKPSKLIVAILVGNNIALVVYGIAAAALLNPWIIQWLPDSLNNGTVLLLVQTVIATVVILFFAEFLPKILFRIQPNKILAFFSGPIALIYILLYPLVFIFTKVSDFFLQSVFHTKQNQKQQHFSSIDIDHYINEFNTVNPEKDDIRQEIMMVQNVMDLKHVKLRECMIPRTEIVAVGINQSIEEINQKFVVSGFSKLPIYTQNIDEIIGYVHAYDLFKQPKTIKEILRPIDLVPETMFANKLLKEMIETHKSIAVVVDEFGGTSGILTLEDLMEEIFGEIEDEFDTDDVVEKQISETQYIFSGRIEIDYLNEKYGLEIPESSEYETLGGFITHHHQCIPEKNARINIEQFEFRVLQATNTRIEKVMLIIHPIENK